MSIEPTITPPNRAHLAALLLGGALGVAVGDAVVWAMGGPSPSIEAATLAIATGTLVMIWPALLSSPLKALHWAALAIGGSSLRLAAIVIVAAVLDLALPVSRQAYWLGIVSGALAGLTLETAFLLMAIRGMKPALSPASSGARHA